MRVRKGDAVRLAPDELIFFGYTFSRCPPDKRLKVPRRIKTYPNAESDDYISYGIKVGDRLKIADNCAWEQWEA